MTPIFKALAVCGLILAIPAAAKAPASGPVSGYMPEQVAWGASTFSAYCSLCHDNSQHMISDIGPPLFGVAGRRVGSVEGYAYSPALQASYARGDIWDAARLDAFLTNPEHSNPGTAMPMHFSDAAERTAIIAYLTTLTPATQVSPAN